MHISDFLSRHPIENGESPHEIIPIAFQLIEKIMQIKENEQGELYWATDYEQDVLYINALKDENVTNLFPGCISGSEQRRFKSAQFVQL